MMAKLGRVAGITCTLSIVFVLYMIIWVMRVEVE